MWLTPLSGDRYNGTQGKSGDAAIIVGRHKLIVGDIGQSSWTGPVYPNASRWPTWATIENCTTPQKLGCLFDIFGDPSERSNLALTNSSLWSRMLARVDELQAGLASGPEIYSPVRGKRDPRACAAAKARGGYWGPFAETQ